VKRRLILCYTICTALIGLFLNPSEVLAAEINLNLSNSPSTTDQDMVSSPLPLRSVSLAACFDAAEQNNKDLVVARRNLPIAQAGIKIANALPNIQFQLQTGFGPSFTQLFTGQTQQIYFGERLQTAGKRSKQVNLARAHYELTEFQYEALRFDVHNRVRRAYAELAAAEAYEALIEAQKQVGLKLASIAKMRFDAGKAPQSDVLQANLNVMQFDTQRNQAQGRLEQDSAALSLVTGEKPEHIEVIDVDDNGLFKLSAEKTAIVPSPSRSLPLLALLISTAHNARPDLQAAEQQIFVSRRALSLARAQRIPDLFVAGGYAFSTFGQHQPIGLMAQPNWLGQGAFFTISTQMPIFYQRQGEIQQALANVRQSEKKVDLLKSQIAADIVVAYNSVNVARANIFAFQTDLLPLASEVARASRRGYRAGATDLATAIVAQQQYQQTLSNYFDAVVAYQNAYADLEKAVGVPLNLS
jgi:cobalt-zinc-cadmium efflux system outer membrane protein